MEIVWQVILIYLLAGVVVLWLFDLVTKRIRTKLGSATADTMQRMGEAGHPMTDRTARVFFLILMWVFWPFVLVGAATDSKEKKG